MTRYHPIAADEAEETGRRVDAALRHELIERHWPNDMAFVRDAATRYCPFGDTQGRWFDQNVKLRSPSEATRSHLQPSEGNDFLAVESCPISWAFRDQAAAAFAVNQS